MNARAHTKKPEKRMTNRRRNAERKKEVAATYNKQQVALKLKRWMKESQICAAMKFFLLFFSRERVNKEPDRIEERKGDRDKQNGCYAVWRKREIIVRQQKTNDHVCEWVHDRNKQKWEKDPKENRQQNEKQLVLFETNR